MSGDAAPTLAQKKKNLDADSIYYLDMMQSNIPLTRERGVSGYKKARRARYFLEGCSHCGEPFANHPGLWTLNTEARVGDKETVNTGIFEVCYIIEVRKDRMNYLGHKVEPLDPCDEEFMEDISS